MKKYNDTIAYTMDELVDLFGGDLYNELNGKDELGLATCIPELFGYEVVFLQNRFSAKALNALRNALK
nr:MAG TPA: peptidase [Caudoviricetes sp.]